MASKQSSLPKTLCTWAWAPNRIMAHAQINVCFTIGFARSNEPKTCFNIAHISEMPCDCKPNRLVFVFIGNWCITRWVSVFFFISRFYFSFAQIRQRQSRWALIWRKWSGKNDSKIKIFKLTAVQSYDRDKCRYFIKTVSLLSSLLSIAFGSFEPFT